MIAVLLESVEKHEECSNYGTAELLVTGTDVHIEKFFTENLEQIPKTTFLFPFSYYLF